VIVPAALLALAAPGSTAIPPATPAWEARKVEPNAVEVKAQTYVVQPGDTLSHVVRKTGAGADAIVRTNGIAPPYTLRPRQKLLIPAGRYHRVGKGESGIAIARAYGVAWGQIATLNHIEQGDLLREGDRLLVPSRREVSVMSLDERARAFDLDIDDLVTGTEPALAKHARPVAPVTSAATPPPADQPVAEPKGRFAGRFVWPLHGRIVRPFGPLPTGARNNGVNIAARPGEPVIAAADGVIAFAGPLAAFGNLVLIRHAGGWNTVYGHLRKLAVTRGQAVKRGQPIGEAGATGAASEPQLHFEILNGRQAVNPIDRLPVE
jgi:murein DD-endopeptidase MepM/ murein hydrolase activator NlpD